MATPISVTSPTPKVRVYTYEDGTSFTYSDGSPAWRNNNPGNLRYGNFSIKYGAIGKDSAGFAIFPDNSSGMTALNNLVTKIYGDYSINGMMSKYAPSFENDTETYQNFLMNKVGVSGDIKINNLTEHQLQSLLQGIVKFEGTIPGKVQGISSENIDLTSFKNIYVQQDPIFQSTLRIGSTGKEVIQLQAKLKSLGYDVSVDGVFGEQTKKAVKDYQSDKGLSADGVAGKDTLNSLNNNQSNNDAKFIEDELDKFAENDKTNLDDAEKTADSDQIKTDGSSDYFVDEKNKTIYYLDEKGNPTQVIYEENSDLLIYGDPANPDKITFTDENGDYQVWQKDKDGNFVQTNKIDYSQVTNVAINQIGSLIIANNQNFSNIEKIAVSSSVATIADFVTYKGSSSEFEFNENATANLQGAIVSFAVSAYFAKNRFLIKLKFFNLETQKRLLIIYNIINTTNTANNPSYLNFRNLFVC